MCSEGNGIIAGLIVAAAMLVWAFAGADGRQANPPADSAPVVVTLSLDPLAIELRHAGSSLRVTL